MRFTLRQAFVCAFAAAVALPACAARVQAHLSIHSAKSEFHAGEPIVLELTLRSDEPIHQVQAGDSRWPLEIDSAILNPMQGVFPIYDDFARGHAPRSDAMTVEELLPDRRLVVRLTLTDIYRFDEPGRYQVHVVTRRTRSELVTNDVAFSIRPADEREEGDLAQSLEERIRQATDMEEARALADQLNALPGDTATRAKISLYLQPKVFEPFSVDVGAGLWIARNRPLVVSSLEAALADPQQYARLDLLIALKARLEVPYDPADPTKALPTDALEAGYIHELAASLPARSGEILTDAARTVLAYAVDRDETKGADFAAAREALIAHFSSVSEWTADTLLMQYGKYLDDTRMLPALRQMLAKVQDDPTFSGTRAAIYAQMALLKSDEVSDRLLKEACSEQPAPFNQVRDLTAASTLPPVDACLRSKLRAETTPRAVEARQRDLAETLEYIARFATPALVPEVRRAYLRRTSDWDQSAQGAAVTYLMRWDAVRSRALLEPLLPGRDPSGMMWLFLVGPAYPPVDGLRSVFHAGLLSARGRDEGTYAYLLAQTGTEEDRQLMMLQLKEVQARLAMRDDGSDSMAEIDMMDAINHGRNWEGTSEEKEVLAQSCVTATCKQHFAAGLRQH